MEDPSTTLLPYIFDGLTQKPHLRDTMDNLCHTVQQNLNAEQNRFFGNNLRNSIQKALFVAEDLGIISVTEENVRIPFSLKTRLAPSEILKSKQQYVPEIGAGPTTYNSRNNNNDKNNPNFVITPRRYTGIRPPKRRAPPPAKYKNVAKRRTKKGLSKINAQKKRAKISQRKRRSLPLKRRR